MANFGSVHWVETFIPKWLRPYIYLMRLQNIRACPLMISPCFWSIAISTEPGKLVDVKMLAIFSLAGLVHTTINMTINDIIDRNVDAKVKRTKNRPLASGALTLNQALVCLGVQLWLCYSFLLLTNDLSRKWWFATLVLVFTYPVMKRVTYWPQAYLGIGINLFNFVGWAAVKGSIDTNIMLPMFIAGFFWVMVFETIYSHQDKEDDAKLGLKSPSLLLGNSKISLCLFAAACISALVFTGLVANIGWPYYASLVAASIHYVWQIWSVDLDSPRDCLMKFLSSVDIGLIVFGGILLGRLYQ